MHTLAECLAAQVPLFRFGSLDLVRLHEEARDPAFVVGQRAEGYRLTGNGSQWSPTRVYPVLRQEYGWQRDGFQYVVDHGGFYTLNRIERGQVVPASLDLT